MIIEEQRAVLLREHWRMNTLASWSLLLEGSIARMQEPIERISRVDGNRERLGNVSSQCDGELHCNTRSHR